MSLDIGDSLLSFSPLSHVTHVSRISLVPFSHLSFLTPLYNSTTPITIDVDITAASTLLKGRSSNKVHSTFLPAPSPSTLKNETIVILRVFDVKDAFLTVNTTGDHIMIIS